MLQWLGRCRVSRGCHKAPQVRCPMLQWLELPVACLRLWVPVECLKVPQAKCHPQLWAEQWAAECLIKAAYRPATVRVLQASSQAAVTWPALRAAWAAVCLKAFSQQVWEEVNQHNRNRWPNLKDKPLRLKE